MVFHVKPSKAGVRNAAASSQRLAGPLSGTLSAAAGSRAGSSGPQLELRDGSIIALQKGGLRTELNISMRWYNASDGADGAIASGAYIFRCSAAPKL